ncbi:YaiI/YqxD family protein [Candidatus Uabimicrobium amorphum]|uniref:UPF0178 protein UABAM_01416 n=1 Tax=Uabimicrobium amorphum TaxID=2596890 RepID=A0A5S9IKE3_UABAM|nr:YaiI/YqxD family protein [Candidatus Uabimicrobium amorphum]BBM83066.1 UPF0178 protein [Candidatus Uabimicrobium amorphum]
MRIFIDADGCPVKQEVYRVAQRYKLNVVLVANTWMKTPQTTWAEFVMVNDDLDAADDWIVDNVAENDIVVTADIPLASRSLDKGAYALSHRGRIFDDDNIKDAVATRDLQAQLREAGMMTRGPAPFQKKDRSRFLQSLDLVIQKIYKKMKRNK